MTDSIFKSQRSYDGWVLELGENTMMGGDAEKGGAIFYVGDDELDKQYQGILSFDTSALPNNAVILSVELKVRRQGGQGE